MSDGILLHVPEVIRTFNVSRRSIATTASFISRTAIPIVTNPDISPLACFGFAILILSTVIGNTLVLSALFLDKRLHAPSFFLIANMAIADLLLGISVLPFSSILELLNDRWIFGQGFCATWLALDVLCCTASIIALMGVSIDRYIGVTRPLNYSSIMTTRRTIYLIIGVWTVSILTSVVPLFGLTDSGKKSKDIQNPDENSNTCKINKNTFYTIFSSMISFYIPVIILLILYSRVYQEAKKQGEKLENERRRLYQIDYQIVSQQVRQQSQNGHSTKKPLSPIQSDENTSYSESSIVPKKTRAHRLLGKRLYSSIKRSPTFHMTPNQSQYDNQMSQNDELLIIKRKMQNLKREKKAFRTVGLILGALLICWLPFFVTLPVMSILKHHGIIKDENTENTWFKITFWLGYCNSALNPFVYAFSNRAIRRAFRQVIFRRCCCCCFLFCRKKSNNEQHSSRRKRANSGSLTTETSQIISKRTNSSSTDFVRPIPKIENDLNTSLNSPVRGPTSTGPVVSFADFLADTGDDDNQSDSESTKKNPSPA